MLKTMSLEKQISCQTMDFEHRLRQKIGSESGFKVPDGYFDSAYKRIADSLPPLPEVTIEKPLSNWQKIKPYFYMAAMFAGIWMMMKVFHTVSMDSELSLDNPPKVLAVAANGDVEDYMDIYMTASASEGYDYEMLQDVGNEYETMGSFEQQFMLQPVATWSATE